MKIPLPERKDMSALSYNEILQEAERLAPHQRLMLIEHLVRQLRTAEPNVEGKKVAWEDYAGSAPYPLCGEDAQAWVSRTRAESDEARLPR